MSPTYSKQPSDRPNFECYVSSLQSRGPSCLCSSKVCNEMAGISSPKRCFMPDFSVDGLHHSCTRSEFCLLVNQDGFGQLRKLSQSFKLLAVRKLSSLCKRKTYATIDGVSSYNTAGFSSSSTIDPWCAIVCRRESIVCHRKSDAGSS